MKEITKKIEEALSILKAIGMPRAQQNERSALCLLALLNLGPKMKWKEAGAPLMGITPIMDFVSANYKKKYAPNTRETFRRQTMHQFVQAGIALYNPDQPGRAVNSPKAVYQVEPSALSLFQVFGTAQWKLKLEEYLVSHKSLATRYAKERKLKLVPIATARGKTIKISPGPHSKLIKQIIEEFAPRFAQGGTLVYVGDTGDKVGYFDKAILKKLGIVLDKHGKMPDVIIYLPEKNWLLLIESVTTHGPVDAKRHEELCKLFEGSAAGLVFVSAFPSKSTMNRFLGNIAWETEVWVAESPSHLIHFNGVRFLGPYVKN